jgi:prepilin-type processing-associated H-X9-DG protein
LEKLDAGPGAPRTVAGSWYPLGGGTSRMVFEFRDANSADQFAGEELVRTALGTFVRATMDVQVDGRKVRLAAPTKASLVPAIADLIAEFRVGPDRATSMANLKWIGAAAHAYAAQKYPNQRETYFAPDLQSLWKEVLKVVLKGAKAPLRVLVSPLSGTQPKLDESGNFAFEPDYVYLRFTMPIQRFAKPADTVLAYERPQDYKNRGTIVLYADGHVAWVKMAEFKKQLEATQGWIAKQEAMTKPGR